MARTKSDDVRDAKRAAKIKGQSIDWLDPNAKGETKGWLAPPTVGKSEYLNKPNPDGFRIDWEEKHHQMGLNLYERFTEGMSPEQQALVDERLAGKGLYRGNTGLNRIDLPRRFHVSSKYPEYQGAHQATQKMGIDSKSELERISSLSPEQKLSELDSFVDNQVTHRKIGQQKFMEQFMLEPGNNPDTNVFGGNFSQQVLQDRNSTATTKQADALRVERGKARLQVSGGNIRMRGLRALPLVGPVIATGIAGQQALAGDFVGAGGTLLDEAVGEVGLDSQPTASGELRDAPANHQAIMDRMNNPTVADKVIADPLNELEYAGKQVMNFFGDALRMGSEAGY